MKALFSFGLFLGTLSITLGQTTKSVLSEGDWYKIGITSEGVFKIDRNFLQSLGVNAASINPKNIKLYGNGSGMLPQNSSAFRYDDLEENAIYVEGENDGSFDNGDYILFYGSAPHPVSYNKDAASGAWFSHETNLYSDTTYYFLTVGQSAGLRIDTKPTVSGATETITTFNDYIPYEKDLVNVLISGREWYGEEFKFTTNRNFNFDLTGIVSSSQLSIQTILMALNEGSKNTFTLKANNNSLGTVTLSGSTGAQYGNKGVERNNIFQIDASQIGNALSLQISYDNGGNTKAAGYLNSIGLNFERELKLYGSQTIFSSVNSTNNSVSRFSIDNGAAITGVWDISHSLYPQALPFTKSGVVSFSDSTSSLNRYIAFSVSGLPLPTPLGRVANQNLHGMSSSPDLLIVTHPNFSAQAEELAAFKRSVDGFTVEVVDVYTIYNEFSSGAQDISAIRDFAKMLYDRGDANQRLRYLLLFGDASYDYKNRSTNNTNFIPVYESRQSLNNVLTYSSDDYYSFLEDGEGHWVESSSGNQTSDIGVGRFPVKTTQEAQDAVDKIKRYVTNSSTFGAWRNDVCFVADDGDGNSHISQADQQAIFVDTNYKSFNPRKLYLDAFEQISSASGESSPTFVQALDDQVAKGALLINYTGHGGETGWMQERGLTINQIESWSNKNTMPLFVTATCEFGRYDDPERSSGAEISFLKPDGGAIALLTTTRPVYSSSNFKLNKAFYEQIFKQDTDGEWPRLGDVIRGTKNNSFDSVFNRNFSLLGDPSLALAYPKLQAVITEVNGRADSLATTDTLRALQEVTISGEIQGWDNSIISDFNGILEATIFEKVSRLSSFGSVDKPFAFNARENMIYGGQATVNNGKFTFSFVVPKDINYQFGNGKISLYAKEDDGLRDASGHANEITIGGSYTATPDNDPPSAELFLDDYSFQNGGIVNSAPLLLARLSDSSGINIATTGIGHEITVMIDDDPALLFVLNDFYQAEQDSYKRGTIRYQLPELADGVHTLRLKVWDTHNNSTEEEITFVIGEALQVYGSPNPFVETTTIYVDHPMGGQDVNSSMSIYSNTGQLIFSGTTAIEESNSVLAFEWNGEDLQGNTLPSGIYLCTILLWNTETGYETQKTIRVVKARD